MMGPSFAADVQALVDTALREGQADGWRQAILALRDAERWARWCAQTIRDEGEQPLDAADYLESIAEAHHG